LSGAAVSASNPHYAQASQSARGLTKAKHYLRAGINLKMSNVCFFDRFRMSAIRHSVLVGGKPDIGTEPNMERMTWSGHRFVQRRWRWRFGSLSALLTSQVFLVSENFHVQVFGILAPPGIDGPNELALTGKLINPKPGRYYWGWCRLICNASTFSVPD
jgi:hypothetical protein